MRSIELLVQCVQQQVDVELEVALKHIHKLVRLELSLQDVLNRDQRTGAGDLDVSAAALEVEHSDLVTADGQIDDAPIALGHSLPGDDNTSVGESPHAVLVRSKLGHAAGALQFALVVELFREWKEETFFAIKSNQFREAMNHIG